jgi:hypothetical protein
MTTNTLPGDLFAADLEAVALVGLELGPFIDLMAQLGAPVGTFAAALGLVPWPDSATAEQYAHTAPTSRARALAATCVAASDRGRATVPPVTNEGHP